MNARGTTGSRKTVYEKLLCAPAAMSAERVFAVPNPALKWWPLYDYKGLGKGVSPIMKHQVFRRIKKVSLVLIKAAGGKSPPFLDHEASEE